MSERPAWCPKQDCEFLHAVQGKVCAGRMSALDSQETGFEYARRICLLLKGQPWALHVNDADVADLRGLLDAIAANATSGRCGQQHPQRGPDALPGAHLPPVTAPTGPRDGL